MVEHQSYHFIHLQKYVHFIVIVRLQMNMYNTTSVNILTADIYNDAYTKTEFDSTLSAYTNSTDLHNEVYSKAKLSIILDTCYNITEIQANYIKTEIDPLF